MSTFLVLTFGKRVNLKISRHHFFFCINSRILNRTYHGHSVFKFVTVAHSLFVVVDNKNSSHRWYELICLQLQGHSINVSSFKADFLSWQKSLAYSLRIFADNFSLLSLLQRVLATWLKIFN